MSQMTFQNFPERLFSAAGLPHIFHKAYSSKEGKPHAQSISWTVHYKAAVNDYDKTQFTKWQEL